MTCLKVAAITFTASSALLLAACAVTPSTAPPDRPLGSAPSPFIALSVRDLERSLPWYRDALGFSVYSEGALPGTSGRYALLQQGSALLELLEFPDARALSAAAPGISEPHLVHGFFKSGFVVQDLEATFERLKTRDVAFEFEIVQPPNGPYRVFGVRDPEGNLLQFFGR